MKIFMVLLVVLFLFSPEIFPQDALTGYEYWADNNLGEKVAVSTSPTMVLELDQNLDFAYLSPGLHLVNLRFHNQSMTWSPVISQFFLVPPSYESNVAASSLLNAIEYWFDGDLSTLQSASLAGNSALFQAQVSPTALGTGIHSIHCRSMDQNGRWSAVLSQFFIVTSFQESSPSPSSPLVEFAYWFDDNPENMITQPAGPGQVFYLNQTVLSAGLIPGIHAFHFKALDQSGKWSAVLSQFFVFGFPEEISMNQTDSLTAYRFWFDEDSAAIQHIMLPVPMPAMFLLTDLNSLALPEGSHEVHLQFIDLSGKWSSVLSEPFEKVVPNLPMAVTYETVPVSCHGLSDGEIHVSVTGGSFPFSYVWNTGQTQSQIIGLASGLYSLTVTDNQQEELIIPIQVSGPDSLFMTPEYAPIPCFGGQTSVTFQVSGGTPPYAGANPFSVAAGEFPYTLTDAHGCQLAGTLSISQPESPLSVASVISATGIDISVSGGASPYTFQWSNSFTTEDLAGLSAGQYLLTVSDQLECQSMAVFSVTGPIVSQTIGLPAGWSIFSTYLTPVNPSLTSVLNEVLPKVIIVKNAAGQVLWPQFGLNSIGNMILGQAYLIKMTMGQTLLVNGHAAIPELTALVLGTGWNLLGYLRQGPASAASLLSPILNQVVIVKNGSGGIFWPQFNINSIGNMEPGQGYQIRLNAAVGFTFPPNQALLLKAGELKRGSVFFKGTPNTGTNMTLGLFLPEGFQNLSCEVGVFDWQNQLVGSASASGKFVAISVWGDDLTTPEKDGLEEGETFRIFFKESSSGPLRELWVADWEEGSGCYSPDGISIGLAALPAEGDAESVFLSAWPNPFSAATRIHFCLPRDQVANILVRDVTGREVQNLGRHGFNAGMNTILWEPLDLPSGTYWLYFETADCRQKLILNLVR